MNKLNRALCAATLAASAALSACGGGGNDEPANSQSWLGKPVAPGKSAGANDSANGVANSGKPAGVAPAADASAGGSSASSGDASASGGGASGDGATSGGTSGGNASSGGTPDGGTSNDGTSTGNTPGGNPSGSDTTDPIAVPPSAETNTAPIVIDTAMGVTVNQPYVTVTLCVPNAHSENACTTVDHMLLDTGSIGVRVMADALGAPLAARLPQQTGASNDTTGAAPLTQCALFGSGYLWGSLRRADVSIGGKTAGNIPVHIIEDSAYSSTPADCISRGGASLATVAALGAKGIVGIGHRVRDFPQAAQSPLTATYYYCATATSCSSARVPLDKQTMNPVAGFATDNNGTIIRLPALPPEGQASVTGELVFGVGTRANNALPAAAKIVSVTEQGTFTTLYGNRSLLGIVDSGTNGLAFRDASIPTSPTSWYTPQSTLSLSATMMSITGLQTAVPFSIANADKLFEMRYAAHDNLGASSLSSNMFIWGLPFYFGRSVYTVLSDAQVGAKTGPFIAF